MLNRWRGIKFVNEYICISDINIRNLKSNKLGAESFIIFKSKLCSFSKGRVIDFRLLHPHGSSHFDPAARFYDLLLVDSSMHAVQSFTQWQTFVCSKQRLTNHRSHDMIKLDSWPRYRGSDTLASPADGSTGLISEISLYQSASIPAIFS